MEKLPGTPFGFERYPDTSGESKDAKKKKKTTRIPRSGGILPKLEADDKRSAGTEETKPKPLGETLAAAKKPEAKDKAAEDSTKTETSEAPADRPEEAVAETLEIPELTEGAKAETEPENSLEGEFADEGLIITRAGAPQTAVVTETASDTPRTETWPVTPPEAPQGQETAQEPAAETVAEMLADPDITAEIVVWPEVPVPAEVPIEVAAAEAQDIADVHRALDANERFNSMAAPVSAAAETTRPIVPEDVSDAYYRGRKHGTSSGVLAGGVFGWWLGRRGKREIAVKAKSEAEKRDKEIRNLKNQQALIAERLAAMEGTKENLPVLSKKQETFTGRSPEPGKTETPAMPAATETLIPAAWDEKTLAKTPEKPTPKPELPLENQPITEETYQAPVGRRIETSVWHRVEIDEKTGRAVENPELAYGEAFRREQQQERLAREAAEAQTAVQVGYTVLKAGAVPGTDTAGQITPGKSSNASADMPPRLKNKAFIKQQLVRRTMDPVTWVTAAVIVVLLFLVGILR